MPRRPRPERRPANAAEGAFFDEATRDGWIVTKRGWPDFFCTRFNEQTGKVEVAVVEVRGSKGRRIKRAQRELLTILSLVGVPCFQWDAEHGWVEWSLETKNSK